MQQEIINYPFDELEENDRSDSFNDSEGNVFIERPGAPDAAITYVNGHHIPDEDEDEEEEDDLILGDEDDLDEEDVDELDIEVDEDVDEEITEDDLVLDADDEEDDEEGL
jgi:hypothetical protein